MVLGILVLLTALTISAVAIYYSVAGLVAIFAAAAIPIMIMGGALEVAKLVTAVWLHKYWHQAVWWLKSYLTVSVIVLMFITSMGIFGFLSKAHIDQTASATESLARLEQLDTQIKRQQDVVVKAEQEIAKLESAGVNKDSEIQAQIDKEQVRIDSAYQRIQPAIDEQNSIIEKEEQRLGGSVALYQEQVVVIDKNLKSIEDNIASGNVKAVQALVGVKADGNLGPATQTAIESYRSTQAAERQRLADLIASESKNITSPAIDAARAEIQRLRLLAEQEIANSNALINRLREQLGTTNSAQVSSEIVKQNAVIDAAEKEISVLSEQKFGLESEYRKLEAEVGPVKYLAEFVYGPEADKNLLEEAVRWVIIIIIFVFDPLAVLLLIASQYTFELSKKEKNERIVKTVERDVPDNANLQETRDASRPVVEEPEAVSSVPGTGHEERNTEVERAKELEDLESSEDYKTAKQRWKEENPDKTIKEFKDAYIQGRITELPWEGYVQNAEQGTNSIWQRLRNRNE